MDHLKRLAARRAAIALRKTGEFEKAREMLAMVVRTSSRLDESTRNELARLENAFAEKAASRKYWHRRERMLYIQVVKEIATRIAANANSVVDVGSGNTPILEWFPRVPRKISIDLRSPYRGPTVESIRKDFVQWHPAETFDVGLCFQVMEHVPDPAAFASHLLDVFDLSIVSVPYKWPADKVRSHIHDPIDESVVARWFDRQPNYSYRVKELNGGERLICVYDRNSNDHWSDIAQEKFRYRWTLRGAEWITLDRRPPDDGGCATQ